MPRARARAEGILGQLATLRDSIENLAEKARQVRLFAVEMSLLSVQLSLERTFRVK